MLPISFANAMSWAVYTTAKKCIWCHFIYDMKRHNNESFEFVYKYAPKGWHLK